MPTTAKQLLALIAPARLGAEVIRINVYKPGHEGNTNSLITIVRFLQDGFSFQLDKEKNPAGDLAQFYANLAQAKLEEIHKAEAEQTQANAA